MALAQVSHARGIAQDLRQLGEGHKFYYGIEATTSPSTKKVLEDEKYKGSIAKEQLMEIYKIIENNESRK